MNLIIYLYTLIMSALAAPVVTQQPASNTILIDKPSAMLYVLNEKGDTLVQYRCALGINMGQKRRKGDHRTPEGTFSIVSIEDSSHWDGDASGSDYGPWFMRLKVNGETSHIGIHGTNKPESIGSRASLGCIRLLNDNLLQLKQLVQVGTPVTITPDTTETDISLTEYKMRQAKAEGSQPAPRAHTPKAPKPYKYKMHKRR